ncbi:SCO6880 family protein [Jiangella endophytica]|uniref:SCO6880 family protein n=1 Tax=Jiangella endophytica TaxID=1623398 RepID=UPI000E344884|nr:SCO6880 family protein [Jiangella endophytica]
MAADAGTDLVAVKFSRLTRRGVLLGLSATQLVTVSLGIAIGVVSLYIAGGTGLVLSSPFLISLGLLTWVPLGGRKLVEWLPLTGHWLLRTVVRQLGYRRRIVKPRPAGTLALPGDGAALRHYDDPESGAVMVHDPHAATLTVVLEVKHPSFVLLDPADQQRRVAGWSRVLATCCRSGRIARLQVLERTLPDAGAGLTAWWREHGVDDGSWVAQTYTELVERAGPVGEQHVTTVSLALDLKAAAREIRSAGGGLRGAAHVLRQEMATLITALRSADLTPSPWFTPGDLAVALRTAYDPAVSTALQRTSDIGRDLTTAGPLAVEETWDRLRSDSAHHAVLWISEWPRTQVFPGFLHPVLLTSGVRRSVTLLCDPLRTDRAARDIRKRRTEYVSDATQRARLGQIEDAQQTAEYHDVLQQESDLVAGHGMLRYTGLIALSAPTVDELESVVAQLEQAAVQASCETRRLVGQQAQAFAAAALPLCRPI